MPELKDGPRLPTRDFDIGDWVEWEENDETFEGWIIDTIRLNYIGGQSEYECVVRISRDELKSVNSRKLTFIDDNRLSSIKNRLRKQGEY